MTSSPISRAFFLMTVVLAMPAALHAQSTTPAPMSTRQVINPPGIAPLVPAYSVAVRDGDLVYVSGMTGIKPGTQDIIEGGVIAQTRQTLENIKASVTAAGATMADLNECTVFLMDMADYAAMNGVYIEYFKVNPPVRAALAVSALPRPAARVEIKCSGRIHAR
jgi:2-iminobutanoate/2-iminopropanoate deaminase